MRPIKFRAWNPERKAMMEPSHNLMVDSYDGCPHFCFGYDEPMPKPEWVLMMSTGLLDKNGKEIWEGDILQLENTKAKLFRRLVTFEKGCFGYRDLTNKFYPLAIKNWNKGDEKQWEVIGNIYENKEYSSTGDEVINASS